MNLGPASTRNSTLSTDPGTTTTTWSMPSQSVTSPTDVAGIYNSTGGVAGSLNNMPVPTTTTTYNDTEGQTIANNVGGAFNGTRTPSAQAPTQNTTNSNGVQTNSMTYGQAAAQGAVGSAPAVTTYNDPTGSSTNGSGWDWSQALSGQAGYDAMQSSQNYVYNPNAANYTIAGTQQYQNQQQGIGTGYGNLAKTALGQMNSLSNTAQAQNDNYQNNVNNTTSSYLNNASGLGNYNSSLASQGSDQQNSAYNAITNMANGNGPSLAAKNLQAGLNQQNQAAHAQSMSNQGLGGAGNAQRNLGNQQTANTNNQLESAQQASVAEQMGALQQENTAANNIRSANQAQASAASSAGLTQRSQNATALANQYSAQLAGNTAANNTTLSALGQGYNTAATGLAGESTASNNAYNSNVAQQQANQAYDSAVQAEGNTRAQINSNAVQSQAAQNQGVVGTIGNVVGAVAGAVASDQNMKTDINQGGSVTGALQSILGGIGKVGDSLDGTMQSNPTAQVPQPSSPQVNNAQAGGPQAQSGANTGLAADISKPVQQPQLPQVSALNTGRSSGGSSKSGGGGILGDIIGGIASLFSDERMKTDIQPGDARAKEFMDKLTPSSFRYKDESIPGTTKGVNLGVMAQDMQKSYIGRELVEKGEDGRLRYSMPKAVNLSLASLAFLNKRLNKLEARAK